MHPLLSRIVCRGAFIGAALAALAWCVPYLAERVLNDQNVTVVRGDGPNWLGPLSFGMAGVALLAILESLAYARERLQRHLRGDKSVPTSSACHPN